jgi:hypothetical protein
MARFHSGGAYSGKDEFASDRQTGVTSDGLDDQRGFLRVDTGIFESKLPAAYDVATGRAHVHTMMIAARRLVPCRSRLRLFGSIESDVRKALHPDKRRRGSCRRAFVRRPDSAQHPGCPPGLISMSEAFPRPPHNTQGECFNYPVISSFGERPRDLPMSTAKDALTAGSP